MKLVNTTNTSKNKSKEVHMECLPDVCLFLSQLYVVSILIVIDFTHCQWTHDQTGRSVQMSSCWSRWHVWSVQVHTPKLYVHVHLAWSYPMLLATAEARHDTYSDLVTPILFTQSPESVDYHEKCWQGFSLLTFRAKVIPVVQSSSPVQFSSPRIPDSPGVVSGFRLLH